MSDTSYLNRTFSWRKRLVRSSFMNHSKYFQLKKTPTKTLRTLNQIINNNVLAKQSEEQQEIRDCKSNSRGFKKIETELEKNSKRIKNINKIRLTKNQKQNNPWNLRDSIIILDKQKQTLKQRQRQKDRYRKTTDQHRQPNPRHLTQTKQPKSNNIRQSYKRIADYNITQLQQKCLFTRYEIYNLFSTFNAIISDSIKFKGIKLTFNTDKFINDIATMLKVEINIAKKVFLLEVKKKYYCVNKNFEFLDFLKFVDQVRKENLREKVNDFLNILFDIEKESLSYGELSAVFFNKNNEKECEDYINKLFSILMKSKNDMVKKSELKELFEANQDMLEMFRKIFVF